MYFCQKQADGLDGNHFTIDGESMRWKGRNYLTDYKDFKRPFRNGPQKMNNPSQEIIWKTKPEI